MMARSTTRSNQRPDTLMQDRSPPARRNLLATHGRTIHWGHFRKFGLVTEMSGLPLRSGHRQVTTAGPEGANSRLKHDEPSDVASGACGLPLSSCKFEQSIPLGSLRWRAACAPSASICGNRYRYPRCVECEPGQKDEL